MPGSRPAFLRAPAIAKGGGKVVIVGGGAGGATVARILKSEAPQLSVTVIETQPIYTTCFNSNHYFGGFRTFASLQHSYDGLRKLGIDVVTDTASDIDSGKRTVDPRSGKDACLRPARALARHRLQVRGDRGLFGASRRDHAARLEGRCSRRCS